MLRLLAAAMLVSPLTTLPTSADAKGASSMTLSLTSPAFAPRAAKSRRTILVKAKAFRRRLPGRHHPAAPRAWRLSSTILMRQIPRHQR
jgi:hypothetical protein